MIHDLYTRSGRLLQRREDHLYSRSGRYLGLFVDSKVFDCEGHYCGTLVGDRVVYRTIDSAATTATSTADSCPTSSHPNHRGTSLWGVEPPFAD